MHYVISIFFGLAVGSFANVCIYRLPLEKSIWRPPSYCPSCLASLRWRDNVPLFSYLWLNGRCYGCRQRISLQYPLVEMTMMALFLISAWRFRGHFGQMVIMDVLSFYLLTISIIDYQHKIIPDELSLSLLIIGLGCAYWNPYLQCHRRVPHVESLLASLTGGGGMMLLAWSGEKIFKKEALGGGDIKLISALGAFLGWDGVVGPLLLGSLLGGFVGGLLLLFKKIKKKETIPFGPFLSVGAYVSGLYPSWWVSLIFP